MAEVVQENQITLASFQLVRKLKIVTNLLNIILKFSALSFFKFLFSTHVVPARTVNNTTILLFILDKCVSGLSKSSKSSKIMTSYNPGTPTCAFDAWMCDPDLFMWMGRAHAISLIPVFNNQEHNTEGINILYLNIFSRSKNGFPVGCIHIFKLSSDSASASS